MDEKRLLEAGRQVRGRDEDRVPRVVGLPSRILYKAYRGDQIPGTGRPESFGFADGPRLRLYRRIPRPVRGDIRGMRQGGIYV